MKTFCYWSHTFTLTSDGNCIKNFYQSVQKHRQEGKVKEKNYKGKCKAFCVRRKHNNYMFIEK